MGDYDGSPKPLVEALGAAIAQQSQRAPEELRVAKIGRAHV